jgi:hypothetical protein
MESKAVRTLAVRIDPRLHKRLRIQVAKLGRPWTLARYVSEALAAKLAERKAPGDAAAES